MKKNNSDSTQVIEKEKKTQIIQSDKDAYNGQSKCPKCGSTDVLYDIKRGKLKCNFCHYEFEYEKNSDLDNDISKLEGEVLTSGVQKIMDDADDIITLKCDSCGAEVVIDTVNAMQARCHWCRNFLSINKQIPNGAVPDEVLPFKLTKEQAQVEIEKFVVKRSFFANPTFKKEFTTENIMGVYFPYMVVDINSHANFKGQGEIQTRRYYVGSDEDKEVRYDADLYDIEREFDLEIDDLTVESSVDKLNRNNEMKTTNIINSIMPFDIENATKWNANYLRGFSSEKRDTNVSLLRPLVYTQAKDIARFAANETLTQYDRGIRWENEEFSVKGERWKAAYLPVWLYSYQQIKGDKNLLHYVAVNARTNETMGSVPIHKPKLFLISAIIELISFIMAFIVTIATDADFPFIWLLTFSGFIFYYAIYSRYRNKSARHKHETETKKKMDNVRKVDDLIRHQKGLENRMISGANNTKVSGSELNSKELEEILKNKNNN